MNLCVSLTKKKGPQLETKNMCKVGELNEFPMPEDFIVEKENIDDQQQPKKRKYEKSGEEVNGCKVLLFPNGSIKSNQIVSDLLKVIKPYVVHFLDSSAVVKL